MIHIAKIPLLFLFFSISFVNAQKTTSFALLIGIDKYQHLPQQYWLDGCKNDIELIERTLVENFAIPKSNITSLVDQQATREAILAQFKNHLQKIQKAGANANFILYFSGHGSQKPDTNGDEEDGKDETLVAYDSTLKEGKNDILDDEIGAFLQKIVAYKAYASVFFDCCHSGTGSRANPKNKTRELPRKFPQLKTPKKDIKIVDEDNWPQVNFLSACQADEKETEYTVPQHKKVYGLLTYHLIKAIQKQGEKTTYRAILKNLRNAYAMRANPPNPTFEGNEHTLIFGTKNRKIPKKVTTVLSVDLEENLVFLEGGFLRDITKGSIFCLVPNAEKIPKKGSLTTPHLLAIVEDIDSFESIARIVSLQEREDLKQTIHKRFLQDKGELADIKETWDAVELLHNYGNFQLNLYLEQEILQWQHKHPTILGKPISLSKLPLALQKVITQLEKEKVIHLVKDIKQSQAILRLGNKTAVVVWADDSMAKALPQNIKEYEPRGFGPIALEESAKVQNLLRRILLQFNKAQNLIKLCAPENDLELEAKLVKVKKRFRWKAAGPLSSKQEIPKVAYKSKMGIQLSNNSPEDLYITIALVDSSLGISVMYPAKPPKRRRFHRKRKKNIFIKAGKSKLFPFSNLSKSAGRETVKIFASTIPLNLLDIENEELPKNKATIQSKTEKSVLGKLVYQSLFRKKRKKRVGKISLRGAEALEDPPQWTVLTLVWQTTGL